ncbi:hypothetical protein [Labrys wisconsinensis]|uniref:Uncharacterized protein n=1 Tax=Labrys wisconsinensis TaxID=425677 RepID=A0ABU0J3N3_9HYPH|nr:hypothetical protein [Labrys wisconsinensis]MDQ0468844.1 hypothetical protein [Labrys wisconsinensis]
MPSAAATALFLLAAAPGEALPSLADVPDLARAAVVRRLDGIEAQLQISTLRPSSRMPGYIACGTVAEYTAGGGRRSERFFVIVPGTFAVLDRDGKDLIDLYWRQNRC